MGNQSELTSKQPRKKSFAIRIGSVEPGGKTAGAMGIKVGTTVQVELAEQPPEDCGKRSRSVGQFNPDQVRISIREGALTQAYAHAASSIDEVGGALLGKAYRWRGRTCVEIRAAMPARMVRAGPAHVTFTAETWGDLLARKHREYPKDAVVGWYHSHPRMGIFLSNLDLEIQRDFFVQPWQVALVLNAQGSEGGFFVWQEQKIVPATGFRFLEEAQLSQQVRTDHRSSEGRFSFRMLPALPAAQALEQDSWAPLLLFLVLSCSVPLALYLLTRRLVGLFNEAKGGSN
jgi:proteasome lid subunit RPN8/RPN11